MQERVHVFGLPIACLSDEAIVEGCPFELPTPAGPIPDPCVRGEWILGALRVLVDGDPALVQEGIGLAWSLLGPPAGPMEVLEAQPFVEAL